MTILWVITLLFGLVLSILKITTGQVSMQNWSWLEIWGAFLTIMILGMIFHILGKATDNVNKGGEDD